MNAKILRPGMLLTIKDEKKHRFFLANESYFRNSSGIRPINLQSVKYVIFRYENGDRWVDDECFLYLGKKYFKIKLFPNGKSRIGVLDEISVAYHQILWDGQIFEVVNHDFFRHMKIL
jgi:hypothetical protein